MAYRRWSPRGLQVYGFQVFLFIHFLHVYARKILTISWTASFYSTPDHSRSFTNTQEHFSIYSVTYSHHLNPRFWSGGFLLNGSIEPSIYKLSSRAPRFFARTRAYFITYCPDTDSLCCQHPSCFFTDIDRCISISVHLISTRTAINSFG